MEINNNKDTFRYTYSAKQQKEIEKIRKRYAVPTEDKMAELRRLDASATRMGATVSIILGIIGTLLLGIGMCFTMVWGSGSPIIFSIGIVVGLFGILTVSVTYPIYRSITNKKRKKLAPEILRITDELLK